MTTRSQNAAVAPRQDTDPAALLEKVVIGGDLSKLTSAERMDYYGHVCESIGLNPLTRPFEYLMLNGKLVLYARRDAADQLRKIHRISITSVDVSYRDDLIIVTVSAQDVQGRRDTDVGVVAVGNARGDARANLILKAVTKGKRRVTLSICGLGVLDESEVDSIPHARHYDEMGLSVTVEGRDQVVVPQGESVPAGAGAETETETETETNGRALPQPKSSDLGPVVSRESSVVRGDARLTTDDRRPTTDTDWTGTGAQLRARIERDSGLELRTGQDWAHLARLYEQPEPLCAADMTQEWLLLLHQEMTARAHRGKIAVASSEDEVIILVREALGDREKRHISMAHYLDLSAQGEARKAELSAPLLAGVPQAVAS